MFEVYYKKQWSNEKEKTMDTKKVEYEVPKIITYTEEEILEKLGPAHTVTSGGPPPIEYP